MIGILSDLYRVKPQVIRNVSHIHESLYYACSLFLVYGLMQRLPSAFVVGENKVLFNSRLHNTSIVK
jgi:hypothetical protein